REPEFAPRRWSAGIAVFCERSDANAALLRSDKVEHRVGAGHSCRVQTIIVRRPAHVLKANGTIPCTCRTQLFLLHLQQVAHSARRNPPRYGGPARVVIVDGAIFR